SECSPDRHGCADRTSDSSGSAAVPKPARPATGFSRLARPLSESRRTPFQSVFVMQSVQNRLGHNLMTGLNMVADKGRPTLKPTTGCRSAILGQVASDCSR